MPWQWLAREPPRRHLRAEPGEEYRCPAVEGCIEEQGKSSNVGPEESPIGRTVDATACAGKPWAAVTLQDASFAWAEQNGQDAHRQVALR